MTTGATGQLGLALPVQGELSGTWGDTVNNGITQYANIAIAATLTLTNDGAVTLANTTGDASASNIVSSLTGAGTVTAQFAIVRVTGTLTTAKVVTAPSYSKTYVVVNAATGGIVTFKASGQTGVSIAVGESAWVYYNGTDYVKLVGTATAGAAGGSNTQVQYNSSGSLAGSSNLTFDGTNLTLGGGTANGVTYLNGSKVLTSGSALVFDGTNMAVGTTPTSFGAGYSVLTVQGSTTGFVQASNGTIVTEVGTFGGIGYTGTRSNHSYGFVVNGAEQMRLTSTGLGIGTSSPAYKLDVNGTIAVPNLFDNSGSVRFKYSPANAASRDWRIVSDIANYGDFGIQQSTTQGGSTFDTKLMFSSAGNLGLGVTPSAWNSIYKVLQVGTSSISSSTTYNNATFGSNVFYNAGNSPRYIVSDYANLYGMDDGVHAWYNAASGTAGNAISFTQAMTLDASGNLGVGVTSPATRLEVIGASEGEYFRAGGGTISARSLQFSSFTVSGLSGVGHQINVPNASGVLTFATGSTERARISAAGGFSVGTTADPGAGAIYATGNITAYYSSDIKFKENVRDIPDALATVNAIGGKLFDWTDEYIESKGGADGYFVQKADFGVVAQDVQKVFPIAVRTREDGSLAVDYEKLGALAFAALVELTKRVEALEAK